MVEYIRVKKDTNRFVLTELGKTVPNVSSKYESNYFNCRQYEKVVPKKWLDCGYVEEVDG